MLHADSLQVHALSSSAYYDMNEFMMRNTSDPGIQTTTTTNKKRKTRAQTNQPTKKQRNMKTTTTAVKHHGASCINFNIGRNF